MCCVGATTVCVLQLTSMENQVISVIVPVCDVADYLDDCLRSTVAQTYGSLQIILVDDGSADGSETICDQWAQRDGRISVYHQPNRGLSAARNLGLDHATGEFVAFVDSDDTVDVLYVETLHRALCEMGVPCVMCGFVSRQLDGFEIAYRPTTQPTVVSSRQCLERALTPGGRTGRAFVMVWCRMCRRSLFEDCHIRFPEGEVFEDVSVMFPVVQGSGRVGLIPDLLYYNRVREGSIVQTNSAVNNRDRERARERFARAVAAEYPDLRDAADRYLELGRISAWLNWQKLLPDDGGVEACEGADNARRLAVEHWDDLALPGDVRQLMTLQLLRFAPALAPAVQRAWACLCDVGFRMDDVGRAEVVQGVKKGLATLFPVDSRRGKLRARLGCLP